MVLVVSTCLPQRIGFRGTRALSHTPTTYYGAIEVPLDADTVGIGFTSLGLGEDPVFYVAELDTSFLAEFPQQ